VEIKYLTEKFKKLENEQRNIEKNVENMNFTEISSKVKNLNEKVYTF
jgi:hypothetical protein